jgi:hypothetical protein
MTHHRNTIIRGDCLELLPQLAAGSVGFILTDPPYITRYKSRDGRTVPNDDNDAWLQPAFAEMYRVLARNSFAVSFYGWPHADRFMGAYRGAGFRVVGHFVFPKRYTSSQKYTRYQHECAYLLAKGNPDEPDYRIGDVIDWTYTGNKLHPTQIVFGCTDVWGNDLAAKVLKPTRGTYEEVQAAAQSEFGKLLHLRHPNITYVFDAFELSSSVNVRPAMSGVRRVSK